MSEAKLSKKDIAIAVLIMIAAFAGLPLLIWGYSNVRLWNTVHAAQPEIKKAIESNLPDTKPLIQFLEDYRSKNPNTVAYGDMAKQKFPDITSACDKLKTAVGNAFPEKIDIIGSYYNCYATYVEDPTNNSILYIHPSGYASRGLVDMAYRKDLEEMLASPDAVPMNIHGHPKERKIHAVALIHRDPILLLEMAIPLGYEAPDFF